MTATDFKKAWKEIEGKAINVAYGKQVFKNIILKDYNEEAATVKTTMQGLLNTRAIKSIELVEHRPEIHPDMLDFIKFDIERGKEEFVEAEIVQVTPKLPDNWDEVYFAIVGKLGGNWKHAELRDRNGNLYFYCPLQTISETSFFTSDLVKWCLKLKEYLFNSLRLNVRILVNDTFCVPVHYNIKEAFTGYQLTEIN